MASERAIDPNVEKEVMELLSNYRQTYDYSRALAKLEQNYDVYQTDIQVATAAEGIRGGAGVETFEQANELLEITNFNANKTIYKKIGLFLGVDPEFFEEFRIDPEELPRNLAERLQDSIDLDGSRNILYENNQRLSRGSLKYNGSRRSDPLEIEYNNEAIFFQNSISQYFIDLGFYTNKRSNVSGVGNLYIQFLRDYIFGLLEQMLNAMPEFETGEVVISEGGAPIIGGLLGTLGVASPGGVVETDTDNRNFEIMRAKEDLSDRILQIDAYLNGSLEPANIDKYQSPLFYFSVGLGTDRGAYLRDLLKQIINDEQGDFNTVFRQADNLLNVIYEDRLRKIEQTGFQTNENILINKQLQDILAFFGASTLREEDDTPEGSIKNIAEAPKSIADVLEAPILKPFDFQCYLLENIAKIVEKRKIGGPYKSDYKNVIPINTNGDPGTVLNRIEAGSKKMREAKKELLNICPEVHGLLTPYLKISRVEYEADGKIAIDPETKKAIVKDLKIPNFLTEQDIQSILDPNGGRVPGAGIKSFSWSLDGVQPAEVDNNITAELVIYFQSVNDFFSGASTVDGGYAAGRGEPTFLDLIINSPRIRKRNDKTNTKNKPEEKPCNDDLLRNNLYKNYEGKDFRVKITSGWSVPPKKAVEELVRDPAKAENLLDALEESRISLYLQMVQHQITFNQNGSLELNISYRASLAGLLSGRTSNIFDQSSAGLEEDIERLTKRIDSINEQAEDEERTLSSAEKEKVSSLTEELRKLRNIDRNVKYQKLLKRLFQGGSTPGPNTVSNTKIYNISLNPAELTQTPYKDLTPKQRSKRVKRKLSEDVQVQSLQTVSSEILQAINDNKDGNGKDVADAHSNISYKKFDQLVSEDQINIPFIFLGDLFDSILDQIKENYPQEVDPITGLNFKFFMSDVEMIDPLQAFKIENLEDLINCGYNLKDIKTIEAFSGEEPLKYSQLNGIYRTMNIGDIPISLDAFQLWFKENVIKVDRSNYYFLYFVKDICKDLITKALSSKCFGSEFKFQQRFDARPLTITKNKDGSSRFYPGKLSRYTVADVAAATLGLYSDPEPTEVELGLILYSTDSNPRGLNGDYPTDLDKGIYHHFLGSSCGLVKQINFQREDQPYLRESRIQKQGALGAEQLRELYSANIELVGNVLYKNGMYIYIDATLLGATKEALDYLGLHGYYLVTKVQSKVTPNSFDVSIRALHEGIKFGDQTLQPTSVAVVNEPDRPEQPPPQLRRQAGSTEEPIPAVRNLFGDGRSTPGFIENAVNMTDEERRGPLQGVRDILNPRTAVDFYADQFFGSGGEDNLDPLDLGGDDDAE